MTNPGIPPRNRPRRIPFRDLYNTRFAPPARAVENTEATGHPDQ